MVRRVAFLDAGSNKDALTKALGAFLEACNNLPKPVDACLVVASKQHFLNSDLAQLLGANAKMLSQGEKVKLENIGTLRLESMTTFPNAAPVDAALCVFPNGSMLDLADSALHIQAIVAVAAYVDTDILEWVATWGTDVIGNWRGVLPDLNVSETVARFLTRLTASNQGAGLVNPRDRGEAVWVLKKLRDKNVDFTSAAVRAWAVRNGWTPAKANALRQVAQKVLDRRPQTIAPFEPWDTKYFNRVLRGDEP